MPRLGAISTNRAVVRAAMTRASSILVSACGYAKHEALLIEEARTVEAGASATLSGEMVMAGKPSPLPIYYLMRIIQPTTNEKPRLCPFRGFSATPRQSLVRL